MVTRDPSPRERVGSGHETSLSPEESWVWFENDSGRKDIFHEAWLHFWMARTESIFSAAAKYS